MDPNHKGIARHHRLLIWALVFIAIGLVNASIYGNTGRVYHLVLAIVAATVAVAWFGWSETVRARKEGR